MSYNGMGNSTSYPVQQPNERLGTKGTKVFETKPEVNHWGVLPPAISGHKC